MRGLNGTPASKNRNSPIVGHITHVNIWIRQQGRRSIVAAEGGSFRSFTRFTCDVAQWLAHVLFRKELADRGTLEEGFYLGDPLIQPLVQRAEATPMRGDPERTVFDTLERIDGVDDIEDGQLIEGPGKHKPPMQSPLCFNQAGPA